MERFNSWDMEPNEMACALMSQLGLLFKASDYLFRAVANLEKLVNTVAITEAVNHYSLL